MEVETAPPPGQVVINAETFVPEFRTVNADEPPPSPEPHPEFRRLREDHIRGIIDPNWPLDVPSRRTCPEPQVPWTLGVQNARVSEVRFSTTGGFHDGNCTAEITFTREHPCDSGTTRAAVAYSSLGDSTSGTGMCTDRWGSGTEASTADPTFVERWARVVTYEQSLRTAIEEVTLRLRTDPVYVQEVRSWLGRVRVPDLPTVPWKTPTSEDKLREMMRLRASPAAVAKKVSPLKGTTDEREVRARETLASIIGMDRYLKYLKRGFIAVRAASGLVYHIAPGSAMTSVYEGRKLVKRLCIHLGHVPSLVQGNGFYNSAQFPPTDEAIIKYLLLVNDEQRFVATANSHHIHEPKAVDHRPLADIYRDLKAAAG